LIARQIGQKQDEATASSCLMVATALSIDRNANDMLLCYMIYVSLKQAAGAGGNILNVYMFSKISIDI